MTVPLYTRFVDPYKAVQDGLTVEAWPADLFVRSPKGTPQAYPVGQTPTATATTSSGAAELTGLTSGDSYYISIIDINGKPWFFPCPAALLGNTALTPRQWGIYPAPATVTAAVPTLTQVGGRIYLGSEQGSLSSPTIVNFDRQDYASGGVAANYPDIEVGPAGLYVVTATAILVPTEATAGFCTMLVLNGGGVCGEAAGYGDGTGTVALCFSDVWKLTLNTVIEVHVSTPDDSAYKIYGIHPATDLNAASSLAVAYVGSVLS